MSNLSNARVNERGAVSIKTILVMMLSALTIFSVLKITPVYMEQRQVVYEVDELANKAAVRNLKADEVKKAAESLRAKYELPEGSINVMNVSENKTQINVSYNRVIDLLLTKYNWKVDYLANGKSF
ncbi:MAG: hypothetical protein AB1757_27555 [Acidobacteriota bacterium]